MPGIVANFLQSEIVHLGHFNCFSNRCVAQGVRPGLETVLFTQSSNDSIETGLGEAIPFFGWIEIGKHWSRFDASDFQPFSQTLFRRLGQTQSFLFGPPFTQDSDAASSQVNIC